MTTLIFQDVGSGFMYAIHPHHRNRHRDKSQWTITTEQELTTFRRTLTEDWIVNAEGWGFHLNGEKVTYLGFAQDHITAVFLAKFVDGNRNGKWHGYPADHQNNSQDRPPESVQRTWIASGTLPRPKIRKLAKGQPCSL